MSLFNVIDIGSTKISIATGILNDDKFLIQFLKSYNSAGLKKGRVIDMEGLSSSIKKALEDAEIQQNIKIKKASVCYSGLDVRGIYSNGAVRIRKREISEEDVNFAIESATAMSLPADQEVIHVLPVEFIVDGNNGIKDPVGMKGLKLESKVYTITASSNQIQNIITCCSRAGVEVEDVILQGIASSEAVLSTHDKEIGTMVIDIGGGTIDLAVFYEGSIRYIATYGIGGNHITNDLSIGLKISYAEAERIKKQFGVLLPNINLISSDNLAKRDYQSNNQKLIENISEIEIVGLDRQPVKIPMSIIKEIIYARSEEILEIIKKEILSLPNDISLSSIIFTGGTSLMSGFISLAEAYLSIPCRVGKPDTGISSLCLEMGLNDSYIYENDNFLTVNTPEFSSAIGALIYKIKTGLYDNHVVGFSKFVDKIKALIRNLIKI